MRTNLLWDMETVTGTVHSPKGYEKALGIVWAVKEAVFHVHLSPTGYEHPVTWVAAKLRK